MSDPPGLEAEVTGAARRAVFRDAAAIGAATGVFGLSFGAVSATSGLTFAQASVLSLLMFTGASQFAFATTLGSGGGLAAAAGTAFLVGARNAFYGLRLAPILRLRGWRRPVAPHLVLDESTAMSTAQENPPTARLAFWATGVSVFLFWNVATAVGAAGARLVSDPSQLGIDAAGPAAFVALLVPQLRTRSTRALALVAALAALGVVPLVPVGVPVLLAAAVGLAAGLAGASGPPEVEP